MLLNTVNNQINYFQTKNLKTNTTSKFQIKENETTITNSVNALANYNKIGISFKGNTLGNLAKWIEQYDINNQSLNAYKELLVAQKDNKNLMKILKNVTPKICSTSHVLNYKCRYADGKPFESVIQSLELSKNNSIIGKYDIQYDIDGRVMDDYLQFI